MTYCKTHSGKREHVSNCTIGNQMSPSSTICFLNLFCQVSKNSKINSCLVEVDKFVSNVTTSFWRDVHAIRPRCCCPTRAFSSSKAAETFSIYHFHLSKNFLILPSFEKSTCIVLAVRIQRWKERVPMRNECFPFLLSRPNNERKGRAITHISFRIRARALSSAEL